LEKRKAESGKRKYSDAYARLEERGAQLEAGMKDAAKSANMSRAVQFAAARCSALISPDTPVHNLADAMKSDRERFKKFFHAMLDAGIYLAPSQFEAGFISTAHTAADIEKTVRAAAKILRGL
jgi:glutamate-1-semialdehyde 2,1-aminomutase